MKSHWENSSSNAIVQDILEDATDATKADIEALISGDAVEKEIIPELTYTDLDNKNITIRQTYLWSILYSTGYLTDVVKTDGRIHKLVIPNKEVRKIYEDRILFMPSQEEFWLDQEINDRAIWCGNETKESVYDSRGLLVF